MIEHIPSNFDLFSENPFQLAVEKSEIFDYSPINSIDTSNVIEIRANAQNEWFTDLNNIYIECELQLLKGDSKPYTESDSFQPRLVNNVLFSLFKSVFLTINSTQISSVTDTFAYREYIQNMLNYSKDTIKNKFVVQGFFESTQDEQKIHLLTKNSKKVVLIGKLNIFNTSKFIIPNTEIELKFLLNSPNFYIIESKNPEGKFTESQLKINNFKCHIKRIKVRESVGLTLETGLSKGGRAVYESKIGSIVTYSIPANTKTLRVQTIFNDIKPSFCIVSFVKTKDFLGSKESDPFIFSSFKLRKFNLLVDNEPVPQNGIEIIDTESESNLGKIFFNLYSSFDQFSENSSVSVDFEKFLENQFFLTFDLTPLNFGLTNINEPLANTNVGFEAIFDEGTSDPLTLLLYVLRPKKFEITAARAVNNIY